MGLYVQLFTRGKWSPFTQSHPLPFSLSLTIKHSFCQTLMLLLYSFTHSLSFKHSFTPSLFLSNAHSLTVSQTFTQSLSFFQTSTHSLSFFQTFTHSLSLFFTQDPQALSLFPSQTHTFSPLLKHPLTPSLSSTLSLIHFLPFHSHTHIQISHHHPSWHYLQRAPKKARTIHFKNSINDIIGCGQVHESFGAAEQITTDLFSLHGFLKLLSVLHK